MNTRKRILLPAMAALFVFACLPSTQAQSATWSERMANSAIERWPDGHFDPAGAPWRWNYELGTLLEGMDAVWYGSAKGEYYRYAKASVDALVSPDGSIPTYNASENQLDSILLGRQLLLLYNVTQDKRYYKAATLLREQLAQQPKNASGGFWHKTIYPNQMWLDGLYMAEPFYAEYAARFQEPQDFAEITRQFILMDQHARDPKTGLLYHGWDESKKQDWANRETGDSPSFWARGMGWYLMALVDTLPWYPENDPGRAELLAILQRTAAAVAQNQDPQSGLWHQVMDKPGAKGNYFEASASCMFTYALAKGVRLGYLPRIYERNANRGWSGIQKRFVRTEKDGSVTLTGTVKVAGLGGAEHRDGSYAYYVAQPVADNDPKGVGAFLLAASEMEEAEHAMAGPGQTVLVDAWFNSQTRTNAAGQTELFHYKWDDDSNSGFSFFGHIWRSHGVGTKTLESAPTLEKLKDAQYYIIVSPDNPAKNPNPHYMNAESATQIAEWVRAGGVLLMMENDPANADIDHMDLLADKFGLHFNNVLVHHVDGDNFAMGKIDLPTPAPPFTHPHVLYMKDTCSLTLSGAATPLLRYKGDLLMASAKYGKGMVFAVTDPWVYNEYTDGRKLPPEYDNFAGGAELVDWLLAQHRQLPH